MSQMFSLNIIEATNRHIEEEREKTARRASSQRERKNTQNISLLSLSRSLSFFRSPFFFSYKYVD